MPIKPEMEYHDWVSELAWQKANEWIAEAALNKPIQEMNVGLDIVREAAIAFLAIDFANVKLDQKFTREQAIGHVEKIVQRFLNLSENFERKIQAGKTHKINPHESDTEKH